jgi:hypothetical protein
MKGASLWFHYTEILFESDNTGNSVIYKICFSLFYGGVTGSLSLCWEMVDRHYTKNRQESNI